MRSKEYFDWAGKELLTIVQVETAEAVANIEEILSVDGVDVFFVGPTDLTMSLGIPGQQNHPKFVRAIERVLEASCGSGVYPGTMVYSLEEARIALSRGFKFISLTTDYKHLVKGAKDMLDAVSEAKTKVHPQRRRH
jgi:2-keto-3-deoxy-L-rhamnonate aldolase RhmA